MLSFFNALNVKYLNEEIDQINEGQTDTYFFNAPKGSTLENRVWGAQHIGGRDTQEDRLAFHKLEPLEELNYQSLTEEQAKEVLSASITKLSDNILANEELREAGSTLLVAIFSPQRVDIGNLGDCEIYQAIVDGGHVTHERLNQMHDLENAAERERVIQEGGAVVKDRNNDLRLNGNLMVTRSLGDCNAGPGFSRVPDVSVVHYVSPEQGKIYFTLSSDGVFDTDPTFAKFMFDRYLPLENKLESFANTIIGHAKRSYRVADNMSLLIFSPSERDNGVYVGLVADGHVNEKVAKFANAHFMEYFRCELKNVLTEDNEVKIEPAAKTYISSQQREQVQSSAASAEEVVENTSKFRMVL